MIQTNIHDNTLTANTSYKFIENIAPNNVSLFEPQYEYKCGPLIEKLCDYFHDKVTYENKTPYFVTTVYSDNKEFPLTPPKAKQRIDNFFLCLLSYLADTRNYNRKWFREIQPEMFSFLDVPGSKNKKNKCIRVPVHSSSYHHHSILLANECHVGKLDALLDKSMADNFRLMARNKCFITSLDVQRIKNTRSDILRVTDYCGGHAKQYFKTDWDNWFQMFPKSRSEFQRKVLPISFESQNHQSVL